MNQDNKTQDYVIVPVNKISEEALVELINEFILREGTDYGAHEYSLAEKHQQITQQLQSGHVIIVFDLNEQSTSIVRNFV
jgi:uncharacterized protein